MHVCAPPPCLMPVETRKVMMAVNRHVELGTEPWYLKESDLTLDPSLQPFWVVCEKSLFIILANS